jgi:hypothetical protein
MDMLARTSPTSGLAAVVLTLAGFWVVVPGEALAGEPPVAAAPGDPSAIIGGENAQTCEWPSAVALGYNSQSCSATLVHPRMILSAAHCGGYSSVHFGERFGQGLQVAVQECHRSPNWTGDFGTPNDFQYCILAQEVRNVPIVPILMGCELGVLSPGREVTAVGFGRSDENDGGSAGPKRHVTTTISAINVETGTAWIGGTNGKSTCSGDSGGPVFVKLGSELGGDDTWRVFGINSWNNGACINGTGFVLMHQAVPWIEEHSGIDITPCFTADGTWEASTECGFFPKEPHTGFGSWPGCDSGPVGGPSSLCGPPFAGEDLDAPRVVITEPEDGQRFEPDDDSGKGVSIVAEIDDMEGWGIERAYIEVNGTADSASERLMPPYSWTGTFPLGSYEVAVVAVDHAGNEGRDTVRFGIGADAPEDPGEGSDDGDDADDGSDGDSTTGGPDDPDGPSDDDTSDGAPDAGDPEESEAHGCACTSAGPRQRGLAVVPWLIGFAMARRRRTPWPRRSRPTRIRRR